MGKRIFLFVLTNLLVVATVTIVLSLIGADRYAGLGGLAVFCFVWGMAGAFISLAMSRFMAKQAMGVRLVDGRTGHEELDWLYATVQRLTRQANLPMPEVGFYESAEVNAFATGPSRSRSLVAVSSGLLRGMRRDEVEGVLAHEVAHIANGDMVTMTLLQGVINAFVMFLARLIVGALRSGSREDRGYSLQDFFLVQALQVVLGILGSFVTAWFSRHREFRADSGGARLAGRASMIAALERLKSAHDSALPKQMQAFGISGGSDGLRALFMSHPPIEQRIAALRQS